MKTQKSDKLMTKKEVILIQLGEKRADEFWLAAINEIMEEYGYDDVVCCAIEELKRKTGYGNK